MDENELHRRLDRLLETLIFDEGYDPRTVSNALSLFMVLCEAWARRPDLVEKIRSERR